MAILITKKGEQNVWEIPLAQGDMPDEANNWDDNTWIVIHLRQLANKIEMENPRIHRIGLISDSQYKSPNLIIESWERIPV